MAGPKRSFVECVGSAGDVLEVTEWGPLLENADEYRDMLLDQGFHMEECMTCGMIRQRIRRTIAAATRATPSSWKL